MVRLLLSKLLFMAFLNAYAAAAPALLELLRNAAGLLSSPDGPNRVPARLVSKLSLPLGLATPKTFGLSAWTPFVTTAPSLPLHLALKVPNAIRQVVSALVFVRPYAVGAVPRRPRLWVVSWLSVARTLLIVDGRAVGALVTILNA